MTTVFGSFNQSQLGAFLQSSLGARLGDGTTIVGNFHYSGSFSVFNAVSFSVDVDDDDLPGTVNQFPENIAVRMKSIGGVLPSPLEEDVTYYLVNPVGNAYQLSETSGGAAIDIEDSGSGALYLGSDFTPSDNLAVESDNNVVYDSNTGAWVASDVGDSSVKTRFAVVTHDTGGDTSLYAANGTTDVFRWDLAGGGWVAIESPGITVNTVIEFEGDLLALGGGAKIYDSNGWSVFPDAPPREIFDAVYDLGILWCGARHSGDDKGIFLRYGYIEDPAEWTESDSIGTSRIRRIAIFGSYIYGIAGQIGGSLVRWDKSDGSGTEFLFSGDTAGDILAENEVLYFSKSVSGGSAGERALIAIENDALDFTTLGSFLGSVHTLYSHSSGIIMKGPFSFEDDTKFGGQIYLYNAGWSLFAGAVGSGGDSEMIEVLETLVFNKPPVVTITNPEDNDEIVTGENINFTGTSVDDGDGTISSGIEWSSDVDGALGTGSSINVDDLSAGVHNITASSTDSLGKIGTDSISIEIIVEPITVTAIDPDSGSTAGGTAVIITGTGFTNDCAVKFVSGRDEETATNIVIVSTTEITCDTPAWSHGTGFVDVTVTDTVTSASGTLSDGFTYT